MSHYLVSQGKILSFVPALIAFAYAFWSVRSGLSYPGGMGWHEPLSRLSIPSWPLGIMAVLGAVIFQVAGNLISDYYDFNHGDMAAPAFHILKAFVAKREKGVNKIKGLV